MSELEQQIWKEIDKGHWGGFPAWNSGQGAAGEMSAASKKAYTSERQPTSSNKRDSTGRDNVLWAGRCWREAGKGSGDYLDWEELIVFRLYFPREVTEMQMPKCWMPCLGTVLMTKVLESDDLGFECCLYHLGKCCNLYKHGENNCTPFIRLLQR